MDVVSTANGDEFDLAEHGDNLLSSTVASGCRTLVVMMMTCDVVFVIFYSWGASTKGGAVSCSMSNKDPKSTLFFVDAPELRLERQP